ncbi:MAG: trimeric intracellular cation channel family protein [Nevskia sp.]|nr:trimeric intracellular cation channel family protein [Nevskia sp.]
MILHLIDYAGVAVFAVSGALAAGRKNFDLLGVVLIALFTSIGGGTVRDLLLDRHPVFWIAEPDYLLVIVAAALLTVPYARHFRQLPWRTLQVADGLGLAFFGISGAQVAEAAHQPGLILVAMGTITSVFGGVLRDVLCNDIPMILRQGEIYATAVIAGVSLYVAVRALGLPHAPAAVLGMVFIAGLRFAAIAWHLTLPVFSLQDHEPPP